MKILRHPMHIGAAMGRMGYPQPKAVCPRAGKLLLLLHYLRTDP
ncbi:INO80 complex subunit 1, partial [Fusarium oxysporum f. sp. albedinis]